MCKIIKYLDYARLNTLEKLYFDLTIMLIVTFLSFLSISKQENFRFYKRKMNCFRLNLKLPNI
ncbi:hypothetical protein FC583_08710 [Campylobacter coli]|nr:hypothetical protein [Campylobacter coli]